MKRGEKFEKMWGEHKNILQALREKAEKNNEIDELRSFSNAYINMEVIEQKYFPVEETYNGVPVSKIKVGLTD